jgi:hypothetical protein
MLKSKLSFAGIGSGRSVVINLSSDICDAQICTMNDSNETCSADEDEEETFPRETYILTGSSQSNTSPSSDSEHVPSVSENVNKIHSYCFVVDSVFD